MTAYTDRWFVYERIADGRVVRRYLTAREVDARREEIRAAGVAPRICGHCGSTKPVGQSCGCFDNGCQ